ncbi:hypothetical protein [Eoetvoesiella caeni]|uniref:Uncharacterized protein n=1 Tax=Eoetvoesiella caeni TaxID=645616 RepID=A0A366HDF8_9BURK|nr:hypothetical protein [Eoetvoesiella caeni]MCI2809364.1 hypothetical protein [Eoetvoesiella caeni]NYT54505.1 hypothetical protein [Eoetvoesiella caeni]RBP39306.1 hypothetical protein DFR37_10598 [Eoetvoesiella caeni]
MTAPIQPLDFLQGTTVVDIGDLRVARGRTRRAWSSCKHMALTYDTQERRVYCTDCETDVEPFDAFIQLVDLHAHIEARITRLREAEKHTLIIRAGKHMDEAWRSRRMAPLCPHCRAAILPEDVANGVAMVNKEMEIKRRSVRAAKGGA